ncbi:MAG: hypothetical protein ABFD90_19800 [Phycisphaerales bacterium]
MQDRMEESRAFAERMKNATSMEERMKIMAEHSVRERARAIEEFKGQLGASDEEWTVIKPRIETVYGMVHSVPQFGPGSTQSTTPVDQKKRELRALLDNKDTTRDQIKAALTALRAANEKVRQDLAKARENLRQIVTLRQEATLVLNGLLD